MIKRRVALQMAALCAVGWTCSNSPQADQPEGGQTPALQHDMIPVHSYRVVQSYAHDPGAFTQGLVIEKGVLYESTGRYGKSSLRRVDLASGDVLQMRSLPDSLFGEGIAVWKDRIVQITWRARTGFVYDRESFDLVREFRYETEGWGLTHDGKRLIMSDGTSTLYFIDPKSFEQIGRVAVYDADGPVALLNELEYIAGEVFANVLQSDQIARIDPRSGKVKGWIDLHGLITDEQRRVGADVLNGIAYDRSEDRLFVTGKNWPLLFEIELR